MIQEKNKEIKKTDERSNQVKIAQIKQEIFAGPIPPPQILEKYGEIDSSFPERIFRMAEKEQEFRHSVVKRSQYLGFSITAIGLICATIMAIAGHPWLAGTTAFVTLSIIVGAYIRSQEKTTPEPSHQPHK